MKCYKHEKGKLLAQIVIAVRFITKYQHIIQHCSIKKFDGTLQELHKLGTGVAVWLDHGVNFEF